MVEHLAVGTPRHPEDRERQRSWKSVSPSTGYAPGNIEPEPAAATLAALAALTDRERGVLALVAKGLTNAEIAERLVVSPATSKTHVGRVLAKLGARDRAQLVMLPYETGLVTPRSP